MQLGRRLSEKRKELGMTQADLADKIHVTRQTVSRWESGMVYPDIEKITDLADILNVNCDYLLRDEQKETMVDAHADTGSVTRLLENLKGKKVKFSFYDDDEDYDVLGKECLIEGFEGNWMQVEVVSQKENIQKLIAVSSVLSVEIIG